MKRKTFLKSLGALFVAPTVLLSKEKEKPPIKVEKKDGITSYNGFDTLNPGRKGGESLPYGVFYCKGSKWKSWKGLDGIAFGFTCSDKRLVGGGAYATTGIPGYHLAKLNNKEIDKLKRNQEKQCYLTLKDNIEEELGHKIKLMIRF